MSIWVASSRARTTWFCLPFLCLSNFQRLGKSGDDRWWFVVLFVSVIVREQLEDCLIWVGTLKLETGMRTVLIVYYEIRSDFQSSLFVFSHIESWYGYTSTWVKHNTIIFVLCFALFIINLIRSLLWLMVSGASPSETINTIGETRTN